MDGVKVMSETAWVFEVEQPDGAHLYGVKMDDSLEAEDYLREKLKLAPDHWITPFQKTTVSALPFRPGFAIVGPF